MVSFVCEVDGEPSLGFPERCADLIPRLSENRCSTRAGRVGEHRPDPLPPPSGMNKHVNRPGVGMEPFPSQRPPDRLTAEFGDGHST